MSTKTDVKNEEGTGWVAPLCHVGLDEMIHAMMNEFFSPSSFWRRMVALVLPPLAAKKIETKTASRRKREQDCKREGGRREGEVILDSTRKGPPPRHHCYRHSTAENDDAEDGRRRQWCVSHAACALEPTLIINAAPPWCSPNDRRVRLRLPIFSLSFRSLPDSSWGRC